MMKSKKRAIISKIAEVLPSIDTGLVNLKKLDLGYSETEKYLLEDTNKNYIIRYYPESQSTKSRHREYVVTKLMGESGIGPKVYNNKFHADLLIIDYIPSKTPTLATLENKDILTGITRKLKQLHEVSTTVTHRAELIVARLKRILQNLDSSLVPNTILKHIPKLESIECSILTDDKNALIHNDLTIENILLTSQGHIYFIDWSEAGIGPISSDLAKFSMFLNAEQRMSLLEAYYSSEITTQQRVCFDNYSIIYHLLFSLWAASQAAHYGAKKIDYDKNINSITLLDETVRSPKSLDKYHFINFAVYYYQCFIKLYALAV